MIVSSIEDVRRLLAKNRIKLYGIGGLPATRSEFRFFSKDFEIICANKTGEFDSIAKKIKITCFNKTKKGTPYPVKKPEALLSDKDVVNFIKHNSEDRKVAICLHQSTEAIEKIGKKNKWKIITNPHCVFDRLDDRLEFYKILEEIDQTRNFFSFKGEKLEKNLDKIFKELGDKIVIQLLRGGGGRGTFFFSKKDRGNIIATIKDRTKISEDELFSQEIIVNKFIDGHQVTVTGCVTRDNGILSSYVQYQLIDIKEAVSAKSDGVGVFCGNDWSLSSDIPDKIHKDAEDLVKKIGNILKKEKFLGIFGIDLIWDKKNNAIVPIEINPRLLGTFPTAVYVSLDKKEIPLAAFHTLEFLGISYKIKNVSTYKKELNRQGSHLLLFNPFKFDVVCGKEIKGGVYDLTKEKLKFVRYGVELSDIKKKNEFILTDGVPVKNLVYAKNRKILRIIAKQSISKNQGKELNGWAKNVVDIVYKEFELKRYQPKSS